MGRAGTWKKLGEPEKERYHILIVEYHDGKKIKSRQLKIAAEKGELNDEALSRQLKLAAEKGELNDEALKKKTDEMAKKFALSMPKRVPPEEFRILKITLQPKTSTGTWTLDWGTNNLKTFLKCQLEAYLDGSSFERVERKVQYYQNGNKETLESAHQIDVNKCYTSRRHASQCCSRRSWKENSPK